MGRLAGKTAIVTGGSRGIGGAIAKRLAVDGARVTISYVANAAAARSVVEQIAQAGGTADAVRIDAGDAAAVREGMAAAAEKLGGLDILVHNAGVCEPVMLAEANEESYRRHFTINVEAVFAGTTAVLGHIRDGGRILMIGSVGSHSMPFKGFGIYAGTKAAVAGMARGWARDLGARGILVNVIHPGPIDTDMNPADGSFGQGMTASVALGRYGRPEEIAAVAAFLASDEASFITGASIDVDGGLSI